jgi:hypothetical protein
MPVTSSAPREHCRTLLRTRVGQLLVGTIEEVIEEARAEHTGK